MKSLVEFLRSIFFSPSNPKSIGTGSSEAPPDSVAAPQASTLQNASLGAFELVEGLITGLKDDHGVHAESLLTMLGTFTGLTTQATLRERAISAGQPELSAFQLVEISAAAGSTGGGTYLVGENLTRALAGEPYSFWHLAASQAQELGCVPLPDPSEWFAWGAAQLGRGDDYGVPDVPAKHQPRKGAISSAVETWPLVRDLLKKFCPNPENWSLITGIAAQDLLRLTASIMETRVALALLMQAAIAASKVPLASQSPAN